MKIDYWNNKIERFFKNKVVYDFKKNIHLFKEIKKPENIEFVEFKKKWKLNN